MPARLCWQAQPADWGACTTPVSPRRAGKKLTDAEAELLSDRVRDFVT